MATRGPCIGRGYVKNVGAVVIFTDLDCTTMLFALSVKSGEERYIARHRVQFRKRTQKPQIAI